VPRSRFQRIGLAAGLLAFAALAGLDTPLRHFSAHGARPALADAVAAPGVVLDAAAALVAALWCLLVVDRVL
jgi:hypothetical protein